MCGEGRFRVVKNNFWKPKVGERQKRVQPDRATWLRHLKNCRQVKMELTCKYDEGCVLEFLKLANVSRMESMDFPIHLHEIANEFNRQWHGVQDLCFEAMANHKIARYLCRVTKILIQDGIEFKGTRFVHASQQAILNNPQVTRICVVILLEKHRRSRKRLDYSKLPTRIESFIQKKLVSIRSTHGIDFHFRRIANGGFHQHQTLLMPFELRVKRNSDLSVVLFEEMFLGKIIMKISIDGFQPCRFRFFLPILSRDNVM